MKKMKVVSVKMSVLGTLSLLMLPLGCGGAAESSTCKEKLEAIAASTSESSALSMAEDYASANCHEPSTTGTTAQALMSCSGASPYRICMCGRGGRCYREGGTYYCGCGGGQEP